MFLKILSKSESAPTDLANELVKGTMRGNVSAQRKLSGVGLPAASFITLVVTHDSRFCH